MGTESHLINIEILDNHEEATIGAFLICDLCAMVGKTINGGCVSIFCHKPHTNYTLRLIY